jgi:hypothetical protein
MQQHKRSRTAKNRRYTRHISHLTNIQQRDAIRAEVKEYSRRDPSSGEKTFHPDDRQKITKLLLEGGCYVEKPRNIFSQPTAGGLARHIRDVRSDDVEWHNFNQDTVNTVMGWIEDGQVLNRPTT